MKGIYTLTQNNGAASFIIKDLWMSMYSKWRKSDIFLPNLQMSNYRSTDLIEVRGTTGTGFERSCQLSHVMNLYADLSVFAQLSKQLLMFMLQQQNFQIAPLNTNEIWDQCLHFWRCLAMFCTNWRLTLKRSSCWKIWMFVPNFTAMYPSLHSTFWPKIKSQGTA